MNARELIDSIGKCSTNDNEALLLGIIWHLVEAHNGEAAIDFTPPPTTAVLRTADHPTAARYFLLKTK
jgi:hypothetical protein